MHIVTRLSIQMKSNHAVVRASDGAFLQMTHYYPWGSVYGDKELDHTAAVARYDYSALAYYVAIPRFDRPDALAGKYPHISPYAFCANNPVNAWLRDTISSFHNYFYL